MKGKEKDPWMGKKVWKDVPQMLQAVSSFICNYIKKIFFFMWTIFKVYWICYNLASVLYFGCNACGMLAPWPGIKLIAPALEGRVLRTEPLGCACVQSLQARLTLWSMDCSLPGSPIHGILQARILEWVAVPSSRGSSRHKDGTCVSCIAGRFFTTKPPGKPGLQGKFLQSHFTLIWFTFFQHWIHIIFVT